MNKSKIFISLQSFNVQHLNQACNKFVKMFSQPKIGQKICFKGPISLPTRRRIYCVLRSPHINKDAREQFEIRRYKKIFEVCTDFSRQIQIENLLRLHSIGEGIKVELIIMNKNSN